MRWTWFIERDGECWSETFATTDQAIAAMAERQGMPAEDIPARMAQIGMFLASVRVTVTPLMVLRPAGVLAVGDEPNGPQSPLEQKEGPA